MVKRYVCNRFPSFELMGVGKFQQGSLTLSEPWKQRAIETHPWYGTHIHFGGGPSEPEDHAGGDVDLTGGAGGQKPSALVDPRTFRDPSEPKTTDELLVLTKAELLSIAADRGAKADSSMNKRTIAEAIAEASGPAKED